MRHLSLAAVAILLLSTAASAGTVAHILDTTGSGGSQNINILSTDFAGTSGSGGDSTTGGTPVSGGPVAAAYLVSEIGSGGPSLDNGLQETILGLLGGNSDGGNSGGNWLLDGFDKDGHRVTPVPEPRYMAVMLIGLLLIGSAAFRKVQTLRRSNAYVTNPQAQ